MNVKKLAQKEYKTRDDWVGKLIHWELYKKFRFNPTARGYMHNPESILGNGMHKILRDFKIETDHLILARRPDLIIVNKKKKKKKKKKREKYLDLAKKLKKLWNMKVMPIVIGALRTIP